MKEFLMSVEYSNKKTELKTYANTVESAVDNMVQLDHVDKLYAILDTESLESWDFDQDLAYLRDLRNQMPDNMAMLFTVEKN